MFTGIVTDMGRVREIERNGGARLTLETAYETGSIPLGASIACSGVCLTVVDKGPGWFAVDVSNETLACTTLALWSTGTRVNLERPLRVGDELGGHIVSGHVDGVGVVRDRAEDGDSIRLMLSAPRDLMPFIAVKGSIAVDGVALTVNKVEDSADGGAFQVNIIPHTARETTLGAAGPGTRVNLEIDMLARYVQRLTTRP